METQRPPSTKRQRRHSFDVVSPMIGSCISVSLSHTHTSKTQNRQPIRLCLSSYIENIPRKWDGQSKRKPPLLQDGCIPGHLEPHLVHMNHVSVCLVLLRSPYCYRTPVWQSSTAGCCSTEDHQKHTLSSKGHKCILHNSSERRGGLLRP